MPKQGEEGGGGGESPGLWRGRGCSAEAREGGRQLPHHTWACGKWESQVELLIVTESGARRANDFDGRR